MVKKFPYLGCTISDDGEVDYDVKTRIAKTAKAFGCLNSLVSPLISDNEAGCLQGSSVGYPAVWIGVLGY